MDDPVDWALAERIAVRVAARQPGPHYLRTSLQESLAEQTVIAEPLVAACTGLRSASPARVEVLDRPEWARANVASFRRLLRPLSEQWAERLAGRGASHRASATITRRLAALELGTVLGALSRRVLGQYDLLITGDRSSELRSPDNNGTTAGDTVYVVGPNLVGIEGKYGFPSDEFRLWVMLHELTHRAQFTGVPWMHDHYLALVDDALSMTDVDAAHLLAVARSTLTDRAGTSARLAEGGLAALVATPGQREAFGRVAGLMALLEGHGDVTMTRAGGSLIPSAARFERVLAARRQQTNPIARTIQRLVGLEAKLNQYALGEHFVEAIEQAAGPGALQLCWAAPTNLPALEEIRAPSLWLERMHLVAPVA